MPAPVLFTSFVFSRARAAIQEERGGARRRGGEEAGKGVSTCHTLLMVASCSENRKGGRAQKKRGGRKNDSAGFSMQ